MDFGKVENLDAVDFTLPEDHPITTELFKKLKKRGKKPEIYIGCAKWGRKDWVGKLYPKGTKDADFLKHYATHFNCIELNAMFYRLFPVDTVEKWAGMTNNDFRFCPKFTQVITHRKRLLGVQKETDALIETYSTFGKKLGTSFIQLDDRFSTKFAERIQEYLHSLPRDFDVAIEFRSPDFFQDSVVVNDTYALMRKLGVSSVMTDTAGRRDVLHMKLTTPEAFIRYVGNSLHPSDYKRIDDWIERIAEWLDKGLQTLYFFIHQHDELYSPELAAYMIEKINKRCGLNISPPRLINRPLGLF